MKITIKGNPEEIADLVSQLQGQLKAELLTGGKEVADILRKQLELLAEQSQEMSKRLGKESLVAENTYAMCEIALAINTLTDELDANTITDRFARRMLDCIRQACPPSSGTQG